MWEKFLQRYHHLADQDFIWFPFLFLRPRPEQTIELGRLLSMSVCFGLYGAALWPLKQWIMDQEISWQGGWVFALKSFSFFLFWFTLVTRPLWNQRARQLQKN